jgi:DNA-binding NtrC family response regulator
MLIDDDAASRRSLAKFLSRQLGHEITSESSCEEALAKLSDTSYPLIITDIKMPGMDGISFLHKLKSSSQHSAAEVVLITGHASLDDAIEALRLGAFDYLLKPINIRQIAEVIQKVEKKTSQNRQEPEAGTARIFSGEPEKEVHSLIQIAGEGRTGFFSKEMRQIRDFSLKLHEHREIPVLIEGETGTGKEIIARLIHHGSESQDRAKPFVCFNCAAISPHLFESELFGYVRGAFTGADPRGKMGKLELAEGGTLFLDEIAEMPLEIQPKLLRVLQEREFYRVSGNKKIKVDIRVIGASNRDISELVDQNKFRRDLYYRINTARIKLPPLRERKKDILPLARLFLNELNWA